LAEVSYIIGDIHGQAEMLERLLANEVCTLKTYVRLCPKADISSVT